MILHIANQSDMEAAADSKSYRCASLESEGFIHCCKTDQLAGVIERYYAGVPDLLLLSIDPAKLGSELVYENTVGGAELFPHVYGPINLEAIRQVDSLNADL